MQHLRCDGEPRGCSGTGQAVEADQTSSVAVRDDGRRERRSVGAMQFSSDLRPLVLSGDVTVSVRLWSRPKVRQGGRYPVADGVFEVDSVELVPFSVIDDEDVRRSGEVSREALRERAAHAGPIDDDTLVYRV